MTRTIASPRMLARIGLWGLVAALAGCAQAVSITPAGAKPAVSKGGNDGWSAPEVLTAHELGSGPPARVASDLRGDAFAVFTEPSLSINESVSPSYLVHAAVRPAGGRWRESDVLSHVGLDPAVAVDALGVAIVIWQSSSGIEEAERSTGGAWQPPKRVLVPGGGEPQVAIDAHGDAIVVSPLQASHHSRGITVAIRSARSSFSTPQTISGNENAFEPRVAMDARGDAVVAWRVDSARGCSVRAAFHRTGEGWSRPRALSDAHAFCEGGNHRVAIDDRGDATVVWFSQRGSPLFVEEATRPANGRWEPRRILAKARTVERPEVAVDTRGDVIVAWWQQFHEWTRMRPAGGYWLRAGRVPGPRGLSASLAMDAQGDALLAWPARSGIVAAAMRANGTRWKVSEVSSGGGTGIGEPSASIDPSRDGVVAWFDAAGFNTAWDGSLFAR